jgi:hypothetical protein
MKPGAETPPAVLGMQGGSDAAATTTTTWPGLDSDALLSGARRAALVDVWRAFAITRAIVWLVGIAVVLMVGSSATFSAQLDPLWLTAPFDSEFLNLLISPGARFDAAWYLDIATFGYDLDSRAAFFPLYPGLVGLFGDIGLSPVLVGIAISCACSLGGLYLLHRLTALDYGRRVAGATTWIVVCSPAAVCLSAVYTEGLFLLLSVGSLYAARLGRWRTAALVAVLAAATRSAGILLIVPLLVMYLYGPRADREPDAPPAGIRPRYKLRPDLLWLAVIPTGLFAYLAYLGISSGDPLLAFNAQSDWNRIFAPFGGIALGLWSGITSVFHIIPGLESISYSLATVTLEEAVRNLVLLGFLVLAGWLTVQTARRLPPAYLAYAVTSLALPLSVPATDTPLMSLPRFMLVVFPFWIALAIWALEKPRRLQVVLGCSISLMVLSTALFVAWSNAP